MNLDSFGRDPCRANCNLLESASGIVINTFYGLSSVGERRYSSISYRNSNRGGLDGKELSREVLGGSDVVPGD
jgi:hypothetical protein